MIISLNKSHKYKNNYIYTECSAHIKTGLLVSVCTLYTKMSLCCFILFQRIV